MTDHNLPILDGTFEVGRDEYVEISMNDSKLTYSIKWPSGYFKENLSTAELNTELIRLVPQAERREQVIRYATDKRRTAFFPHHGPSGRPGFGVQYIIFPGSENRIYFGGGGNSGGLSMANPFAFIDEDDINPSDVEMF